MTRQPFGARMLNLLRSFISNRRASRRVCSALPVHFSIVRRISPGQLRRSREITGHTTDLSQSGMAIETSVIRVDNFHIAQSSDMASEQFLDIELALPEHDIHLEGKPLRYERRESATGNYLVGIKIVWMSEEDRKSYEEYLKQAGR